MRINIVSFINSIVSRHFEKRNSIERMYRSVYAEKYFKRNKRNRLFNSLNQKCSDLINRHVYASVLIMFIGVPSMIVASVVFLALAITSPIAFFMSI